MKKNKRLLLFHLAVNSISDEYFENQEKLDQEVCKRYRMLQKTFGFIQNTNELEFDVDAFIADLPGELREFAEDYPEEAKFNIRCMMLMMQKSKDYLKPKEALSTQRENRRQQWYGDTECDICHREIHNNLYDAQRRDINSEWATMCENCFKRFGIAVRWGIGQKYKQESDGNFYLIDGFPPEEQS